MPWHRACIEYGRDCSDTGISIEGGSRCRVHQRAAWRNAKPRPDLQTREWRALSKRRRAAFPMCEMCGARKSTSTDHIVRPDDGGTSTWENTRALCGVCHGKKSAHEGHVGRKRKRAAGG